MMQPSTTSRAIEYPMRQSFLSPIQELDLAAKLLDAAADALLQGRVELAQRLVADADMPQIVEYASRIVGKLSKEIHRQTRLPKVLPATDRNWQSALLTAYVASTRSWRPCLMD